MLINVNSNYNSICKLFNFSKTEFLSLEKLKKEVKICDIKTGRHYLKYRKEHNKINWPCNPIKHYKIKWSELLEKTKTEFLSLEKLKKEVKICGIKTGRYYLKCRQEHNKINWPCNPCAYYNIKWTKLLGKLEVTTEFLSLEKLKKELKIFDIRSSPHYRKYRKEHNKINWPSNPDVHYNIKWSEILSLKFLSLEEFKKELKIFDIRSSPHYRKYRKEHNKINWPSSPDRHYNIKWSDFLGKS